MQPSLTRISFAFSSLCLVGAQTVGTVTTLAGGLGASTSGKVDAVGTAAAFNRPSYVVADFAGTVAVVADPTNNLIRKIFLPSATVTTLAGSLTGSGTSDGVGTLAAFNAPYGVAMDAAITFVIVVRKRGRALSSAEAHLSPHAPARAAADRPA